MEIPVDNGFYLSDSQPVSFQECTNWYPNTPQVKDPLSIGNLFGTSGVFQVATSGLINNKNRGCHVKAGVAYFLNGTVLYRQERTVVSGVATFNLVGLGTIPGDERASFSDNGKQLIIITGGLGWIVDETASPAFDPITDVDFTANGTPEQVVFLDSFFIVTTNSKKFIKSAANDGTSWNALEFSSAEADPAPIVGQIVHKNQLYIAGSETFEVFENRGIANFPFQRIKGFVIDKGLFAPFGIIKTTDSFMFVGGGVNESPAIWALVGNNAQKVSNTAIDSVLSKMPEEEIQSAFAYSYAESGAYFVGFTFTTRTFEFNTITAKWHERKSRVVSNGQAFNQRWRMNSLCSVFNKIFIADQIDGRIGILDPKTFTEYGEPIIRVFSPPPISNGGRSFSISMLEITMESGVGDAINDPQIRMSISEDAKLFSGELFQGFGKVGNYFRRAIWWGLGWFPRFAVIRFTMSDAVKPVIIKLEADVISGS